MPQVKKTSVNNRILDAAFSLFSTKGYQATSMPDIAAEAGITAGNIYRYYHSKFELFYGVLEPWLNDQLDTFEKQLKEVEDGPQKLRRILVFMWIELPRLGGNFEANLMEALATKKSEEPYSRQLLLLSERHIMRLLDASIPADVKTLLPTAELTHMMFMCHDGFVLNAELVDETARIEAMIDGLTALIYRGDA